MKILIVSGKPHIPQRSGGVPSSTHELAVEMWKRGHLVSVLCGLASNGVGDLYVRALQKAFSRDLVAGYPTYRRWDVLGSIDTILKEVSPDLAIVQIGQTVVLAQAIVQRGVPVLMYLHNVDIDDLGADPRSLTNTRFIANSTFTAGRYKALFNIDSVVIPPLVRSENYIGRRTPRNVTFVNPSVVKGREIALKVAEHCPHIPFTFLESWPLSSAELQYLRRQAARLPNITLKRRTGDMKSIYSRAKLILAPSLLEEAWGRIATEAHFCGIPVVASNIGGLPEAVGPGGILLDPKGPIEPWVDAITRLWNDRSYFQSISNEALAYSKRQEIAPKSQLNTLFKIANDMKICVS